MDMKSPTASDDTAAQFDSDAGSLTMATTIVCAIACGLSVANIYYAQPLLDAMSRDFAIAPATIGLVITVTQVGYAVGLIFIVPLGDLIAPRRLVVGQTALSAVAIAIVGTARTESVLFAGMITVGLLAVVVQVLVVFAANLAAPCKRGQTVGTITSGVVVGILASRFTSGLLADLGGWRSVYLTSAALSAALALILFSVLPRSTAVSNANSYLGTLRSIPKLFVHDPVRRVRGALALLIFATFSTLWTALVLPLSTEPFGFSHTEIGAFGLAGVAGALAASGAGRLADRGLEHWTTGIALALLLSSWALIAMLPVSIPALIGGVILLDLAVQAVHVTNQSIIFSAYPQARSRLVGGYMAFYSAGSALGAIASTTAFAYTGWRGVSGLGAFFSATALIVWACARHDASLRNSRSYSH
ncbi:MFS transporter [Bradyrhizobium sp. 31Argb]|uniref:MFS transporter n=1 Tax=Bradyrhizobium sp. 31Argb TaxID=3141247 RepID=UPI00374A872D